MTRILIVDDDDQIRDILKRMLERSGYEVMEAQNGKKGVASYRSDPCDLVITDILMPEKEGIEMIREMKKEFPDSRIIAMSGGGHVDAKEYLMLAEVLGANRTLEKPISYKDLIDTVKDVLGD